jgi:hypothetical protein
VALVNLCNIPDMHGDDGDDGDCYLILVKDSFRVASSHHVHPLTVLFYQRLTNVKVEFGKTLMLSAVNIDRSNIYRPFVATSYETSFGFMGAKDICDTKNMSETAVVDTTPTTSIVEVDRFNFFSFMLTHGSGDDENSETLVIVGVTTMSYTLKEHGGRDKYLRCRFCRETSTGTHSCDF